LSWVPDLKELKKKMVKISSILEMLMRGWFGCNNGKPRILSEFEAQDEECF
jgi:hypothetical protein